MQIEHFGRSLNFFAGHFGTKNGPSGPPRGLVHFDCRMAPRPSLRSNPPKALDKLATNYHLLAGNQLAKAIDKCVKIDGLFWPDSQLITIYLVTFRIS